MTGHPESIRVKPDGPVVFRKGVLCATRPEEQKELDHLKVVYPEGPSQSALPKAIELKLSSLGDWLGLLATTALATSLATGYREQNYALGGVLVVRLLPAIVLGPLAGAFADRFDRRITMVVSDVFRFGLFLTIPLARFTDHIIKQRERKERAQVV